MLKHGKFSKHLSPKLGPLSVESIAAGQPKRITNQKNIVIFSEQSLAFRFGIKKLKGKKIGSQLPVCS